MKSKSMVRLYLAIAAILFWGAEAHAQIEPQFSQYQYNIGSFNPAYVGTVENPDFSGLYRLQFAGIPGAPRTIRFGANIPFSNEKTGLGFNLVNDEIGPASQTFIDASYSYQIKLTEDTKLSFGLNGGGSILSLDFTQGNFSNPGEPLLGGEDFNQFYPILGAGLFLYEPNWYIGLSAPNLLTNGLFNNEVSLVVEDDLQLNFIGGYVFDFSDSTKFKPALLINYLPSSPVNVNLSANFLFLDAFSLGASYRIDNAVSGIAGFQISNSLFAGYSYDSNVNGLSGFNGGAHEVILKYFLGREGSSGGSSKKERKLKDKPKQIDSPRFF